jgi:PAS domain S-box-containing protein
MKFHQDDSHNSIVSDCTEQALRESEWRFRATFEQAGVGILHTDIHGHILLANSHLGTLIGYSQEELYQRTFLDITHPDDHASDVTYVQSVVAGNIQSYTCEKRYLCKNGRILWIHLTVSPIFNPSGQFACFVSVIEDISERKQLEECLYQSTREAEERARQLEAVFEAVADSISVYDKHGHFVQMNSAAHDMLSVKTSPDYISGPISRVQKIEVRDMHGELLAKEHWPLERTLQGETLRGETAMDCLLYTLDGKEVCLSISGAPIRNETGEIIGAVMIGRDVTAHRLFERRTQEALATIFEVTADNIAVYDKEGRLIQMNSATGKMLGLDAQPDFVSRPLSRMKVLELRDENGRLLSQNEWPVSRMLRGETLKGNTSVDCLTRTLDGREIYANVCGAPIFDEKGEIMGAIAISRDVTARHQLERRTHDALDALMAMAEVLVQTQELPTTSTTPQHLVGQRIVELIQRVLACKRVSLIAIRRETSQIHPLAVIGLTKEQRQQWFTLCSNRKLNEFLDEKFLSSKIHLPEIIVADMTQPPFDRLFNPHNVPSMLIAPVYIGSTLSAILYLDYDTTLHVYTSNETELIIAMTKLCALALEREQKQAEMTKLLATLQTTNEDLERSNKVQRDFVSIVSHEFRTTLTGIQGFSELICEEILSDEEVKEYACDINTDAKRLNRMISELLDLERMQSGRMQLHLEPIELNRIIKMVVEHMHTMLLKHDVILTLDTMLPTISGDNDKLMQVVTNLLSNAVKYSPQGGEIRIRSFSEGTNLHLTLQDSGMGIPADALENIFTPYNRVETAATRHIQGTGLGLPITRQIVQLHGGQIWVESQQGVGSTFHIVLPLLHNT